MYELKNNRIAVIGGGAAGMAFAVFASSEGVPADIFEPNRQLGRKLRITGKGRCNVTNNCTVQEFFENVISNPKFLYSAIRRFTPDDTIKLFESLGVPLKTERGRRVFPVSDKAADIADALQKALLGNGCHIISEKVTDIKKTDDNGRAWTVMTESCARTYDAVIVATGGASYPATGSRGDGYRFAKALGHTVVPPTPSLVPIVTRENVAEMSGLSLKNVRLSLYRGEKLIHDDFGEMLFTHFGLSGPLILSASARMTGDVGNYTIKLDLKPAIPSDELDARILSDFSKFANRDFLNSLGELLPASIIPYIVRTSKIPPHIKVNSITREMRASLLQALKALTFTPTSLRSIDEAIVTRGGVSVKEIDPKTMMSKLADGIYFIGEIIDCDALTGGYNLQIAFSTAHAAAENVCQTIKTEA